MRFSELSVEDLKTTPAITVGPDDTVGKVLGKMEKTGSSTVIVSGSENVEGVIAHRHILERGVSPSVKVRTLMERTASVSEEESILKAASALTQSPGKAIPVMKDGELTGAISRHDLVTAIAESDEFSEYPVNKLMSHPVKTIEAEAPLAKAKEIMGRENIRRLPVTDRSGELYGIITEKDIVEAVYRWERESSTVGDRAGRATRRLENSVSGLMSRPLHTVSVSDSIQKAGRSMTEYHISSLPVLSEFDELAGILTEMDIIRFVVSREEELYPIEIRGIEKEDVYLKEWALELLTDAARRLYQQFGKIHYLRVIVKTYEREGSRKKYSVRTQLKLRRGLFAVKSHDWDIVQAIQENFDKLFKKVGSELEKREEEPIRQSKISRTGKLSGAASPPQPELGKSIGKDRSTPEESSE